jgi:putative iron-only hydrogenase system regulator
MAIFKKFIQTLVKCWVFVLKLNILNLKVFLKVKGIVKNIFAHNFLCVFFSSPHLNFKEGFFMSEKRVAVLSIIVENREESGKINSVLSDFGEYIIGRMGIPYREKNVSIICVAVDAPSEIINSLTGKIGMISGVTAKTLMSKV